jgi:hypothetical protein
MRPPSRHCHARLNTREQSRHRPRCIRTVARRPRRALRRRRRLLAELGGPATLAGRIWGALSATRRRVRQLHLGKFPNCVEPQRCSAWWYRRRDRRCCRRYSVHAQRQTGLAAGYRQLGRAISPPGRSPTDFRHRDHQARTLDDVLSCDSDPRRWSPVQRVPDCVGGNEVG